MVDITDDCRLSVRLRTILQPHWHAATAYIYLLRFVLFIYFKQVGTRDGIFFNSSFQYVFLSFVLYLHQASPNYKRLTYKMFLYTHIRHLLQFHTIG